MADVSFAPVFLRNATAFGASPRMRFDIVLNNLAGLAWTAGRIAMVSDGTPWRPLVHVRDVAAATAVLLDAPLEAVAGEAFNIGSAEQNYRISDLAEIVRQRLPECEVTLAEGASPDPRSYRVDFSKFATAFPDFRCEWTAERGADELATAYQEVGLTLDDFHGHRYIRLNQLRRLLDAGELGDDLRWAAGRPGV